jgi:hypothetical protein
MSAAIATDAALHRLIKRMLTTSGTTSEHLLVLADWLTEAAAATTDNTEAAILTRRAGDLRNTLAPLLAEPGPPTKMYRIYSGSGA